MKADAPVKRAKRKPAGKFHHGDLREQLLVAATDLVEKRGHHGFSMKELATRLGVTEPAVYRHFAGRDALLAEVGARGYLRFVEALEAAIAGAEDPFESIRRYGRAYVRFSHANPGWFRVQFSRAANENMMIRVADDERLRRANATRMRLLEVWQRALPAGEEQRVADLYRLVWGTVHGLAGFIVERVFQLVQTDEERIAAADDAIELLLQSLQARAGSR